MISCNMFLVLHSRAYCRKNPSRARHTPCTPMACYTRVIWGPGQRLLMSCWTYFSGRQVNSIRSCSSHLRRCTRTAHIAPRLSTQHTGGLAMFAKQTTLVRGSSPATTSLNGHAPHFSTEGKSRPVTRLNQALLPTTVLGRRRRREPQR